MKPLFTALFLFVLLSANAHAEPQHQPPGTRLWGDDNWAFVADALYPLHGPRAAKGVVVWAHGYGGAQSDERIWKTQQWVGKFSVQGYDVVRFERNPAVDGNRAIVMQHFHDGLMQLRKDGYRQIIAAGQSRGGWNALQMMFFSGVEDAIIVTSPATFGRSDKVEGEQEQSLQYITQHIRAPNTRLAFVQFKGDPFAGDEDYRASFIQSNFTPHIHALLMIDRPQGFGGHGGSNGEKFADAFGDCLVRFVNDPQTSGNLSASDYCGRKN